jgi:hypothetical protein
LQEKRTHIEYKRAYLGSGPTPDLAPTAQIRHALARFRTAADLTTYGSVSATRIYADFNGPRASPRIPDRLAVALDTIGALRDLANIALRLYDGVQFVLYDCSDEDEDLEAAATAFYNPLSQVWLAEFGPDGFTCVPKRDRTPDARFLCLKCRTDYTDIALGVQQASELACGSCGTLLSAALAPPPSTGAV